MGKAGWDLGQRAQSISRVGEGQLAWCSTKASGEYLEQLPGAAGVDEQSV